MILRRPRRGGKYKSGVNHIVGIYLVLMAYVCALLEDCEYYHESKHKPDCKDLPAMLRVIDNNNYAPLHYAFRLEKSDMKSSPYCLKGVLKLAI